MKNDIISPIFDFNEQVIKLGDIEINPLTQKQHDWTVKFCLEELSEFTTAYDQQDVVGMVDAIGDLIYGAMGTFKKMGLTRDQVCEVFAAIHTANMTKSRGDKGRGSDEDATKPADFVPPEEAISHILFGVSHSIE